MILVVDIGNTQIKLGIFEDEKLIYETSFITFEDFQSNAHLLNTYSVHSAAISSVVPAVTDLMMKEIKNLYAVRAFTVTHNNCGIKFNVEKPETIGADRLCNIAAAIQNYATPIIIVDFGTANTYDVIDVNKTFMGGAISPGIETSAQYLIEKAALLDKTKFDFPDKAIGKTTETNIQSGIMFGAIDQINGMINRIKEETQNKNYSIILTGGFGKLLSPKLNITHTLDERLTLKGLLYIHNLNA